MDRICRGAVFNPISICIPSLASVPSPLDFFPLCFNVRATAISLPCSFRFHFRSNSRYPISIRSKCNRPTDQARLTKKRSEQGPRKNHQIKLQGEPTWPLFKPTTIPERSCAISTVVTGLATTVVAEGVCRVEGRRCGRISRWSLPDFGWLERSCVASSRA